MNLIILVCGIFCLLVNTIVFTRYMRNSTQDRLADATQHGYDRGRDDGEQIGVQRGYRLAMKHCALAAAGRPIKAADIPWSKDEG
jgi:hypothetical protein